MPLSLRSAIAILVVIVAHARPMSAQTPPRMSDSMRARIDRMGGALSGAALANDPELADAINEILSDTSAHMRMAPPKPATVADSARAASVVTLARNALGKYKDVRLAEADGFIRFLPNVEPQAVYHYTNYVNAFEAMFAHDPTKPTSLLYRKDGKGSMVLVGVMYTAPFNATPEVLDARLPLGMAHWHEHVNFCGPGRGAMRDGSLRQNAAELARWLRITSREDCDAAGGRFTPRLFGWMAHAYVFAGDDPKTIWGGEGKGHMHIH